jgi:hypothetical protein
MELLEIVRIRNFHECVPGVIGRLAGLILGGQHIFRVHLEAQLALSQAYKTYYITDSMGRWRRKVICTFMETYSILHQRIAADHYVFTSDLGYAYTNFGCRFTCDILHFHALLWQDSLPMSILARLPHCYALRVQDVRSYACISLTQIILPISSIAYPPGATWKTP